MCYHIIGFWHIVYKANLEEIFWEKCKIFLAIGVCPKEREGSVKGEGEIWEREKIKNSSKYYYRLSYIKVHWSSKKFILKHLLEEQNGYEPFRAYAQDASLVLV
jgi:hypothetical protein